MKAWMTVLFLVILCAAPAAAQPLSGEEELLRQLGDPLLLAGEGDLLLESNRVALQQQGEQNSAVVRQTQLLAGGAANVAAIVQDGMQNTAVVDQVGSGNLTGVQQTGVDNNVTLLLEGNGNTSAVVQHGNNNVVDQQLRGDGLLLEVSQVGNNHELIQVENGGMPRNYTVTQQGNGARIILVNGEMPR